MYKRKQITSILKHLAKNKKLLSSEVMVGNVLDPLDVEIQSAFVNQPHLADYGAY